MLKPDILHRAAAQGLLTPEQVDPLVDFINQQNDADLNTAHDEEQLKFVRNFGDIFITIGVAFVAMSIATMNLQSWQWWLAGGCFVALAEWLVRQRRLALPGMAILLSIMYFVAQAAGLPEIDLFADQFSSIPSLLLLAGCAGAFYWRYGMPFSLLPMALSLVTIALIGLGEQLLEHQWLFTLIGLVVFSIAITFDSKDRQRKLRWSDCGFWLHLLASPLIVHGIMTTLIFSDSPLLNALGNEILLISFFVVFMLVALLVDRRAMLVSSSSYGIYAIFTLLENSPVSAENLPLVVFIGFGLFIIFFGTFWYRLRTVIFRPLQNSRVANLVPDFTDK
ncbi:hypothetical protein [Aliamphritea ceti]|uniref:hypothetical protein n=1 Tax=Aliamphritea ceti TaxID=1524258 RepID=UPI0021C4A8A4|nr:hypothetical protein [Aliamphritea ceti]